MARRPERIPERALLHPLWVAALVLLILNDHLFKGSGLLPGLLTGKLSDFAGMLVAPVVLAVLLRLSSRGALLAAHVAVGVVFAAINVSAEAARGFEAMMEFTLFPWAIVVDPMDLVALPTLLVSWAFLVPAMERPARAPRWLAIPALCLGSLACMATSPPPPEQVIDQPIFLDMWGNLAVANDREETVNLRVRRLKDTVFMDCALVAEDPTRTLSRDLFGTAEFWQVESGRAFALESWRAWEGELCDAFLIDGAGLNQQLVFVDLEAYPLDRLGSTIETTDMAWTLMVEEGEVTFSPHPALFDAPPLIAPEPSHSCETVSEEASVAWSELPDTGMYTLERIVEAPDGCMRLELSTSVLWHLCVPRGTFTFVEGEELYIDDLSLGEDFGSIDGVELLSTDKSLRVGRGQDFVPFNATTTLSVEHREGCGYTHDDCGNLTRPLVATYGGPSGVSVAPGEAIMLDEQSFLYIVRAHDIPVGDTACLEDAIQSDRLIESVFVSY